MYMTPNGKIILSDEAKKEIEKEKPCSCTESCKNCSCEKDEKK